jgi:hypothetical protein
MGGLPRYLAAARIDDPEKIVWMADDLIGSDVPGPVVLLQIGRSSHAAIEAGRALQKLGRHTLPLVVRDRETAKSEHTLARMAGACAVWVFAEDMLETFLTLYSTDLAFHLRAKARAGLPVFGVGGGAVSLGGLLLATRVCHQSQYDLVAGLGWAQRVFVDSSVVGYAPDDFVAQSVVQSLPGLLALQLGESGAVRAAGGRIESIGSEPILLLGANGDNSLMMLELEPGMKTTIAPPPFAPFEQGLLPPETLRALAGQVKAASVAKAAALATTRSTAATAAGRPAPTVPPVLRQAPPPEQLVAVVTTDTEARPAGGRYCAMCKKVHGAKPQLELAA